MALPIQESASTLHQRWLLVAEDPHLLEQVCLRVAEGESLKDLAASWMVPRSRLLAWLMADEERYGQYQRALEIDAHRLVGETVTLADEAEDVQKAKLQIDTRFRVAGFHAKKLYGADSQGRSGTVVQVVVQREQPIQEVIDGDYERPVADGVGDGGT